MFYILASFINVIFKKNVMLDQRLKRIAKILVEHSTKIKRKDRVHIVFQEEAKPLALEIYKMALLKGAYPLLSCSVSGAAYTFYRYANRDQLRRFPKVAMFEMRNTDVYISISADYNRKELSSIDPKRIALRRKVTDPINKWRTDKTRWVICDYPTNALAQEASMSLEEYEDFVFGAMLLNWKSESKKMEKLKRIMVKTNKVRLVGKNTDLSFSIKGSNPVIDGGKNNMPGGEVFTAPVKDSANGYIEFSYPAIREGNEVDGIFLEFKNGKVINAMAKKNEKFLKVMLNLDKGASYLGEFGMGCNYNIKKFTKNLLFDEKIGGTIHLALGNAYKINYGRIKKVNKSALHWDIVKDFRFEGGKIFFDNRLIQKNGRFLI